MPINCVNINLPEVQALASKYNLPTPAIAAKIALWQDRNGIDKWPTEGELGLSNIKSGVSELFESNPDFANDVYEALGFNFRYTSEKWKDDPTKENKATYINIKGTPSNQEFQIKKDIEDGFYSVHFKTDRGELSKDQIQRLIDATSSQIPIGGKLSTWGEITKGGISGLNRFLNNGFKKIGERKIKDREGNDILIPILEKEKESNLEKKAQQLYSQYLDTIFPDSKLRDVVYHGKRTDDVFEKFDTTKKAQALTGKHGIYFTEDKDFALGFTTPNRKQQPVNPKRLLSVLLNIKNPRRTSNVADYFKITDEVKMNLYEEMKQDGAITTNKEIVVFEPEQIHILSSKKDLEMFRNFINFTKSEYAKYGDIQQFRDYTMSKNFAAIEEFLVVNNKIDRKC